MKKVRRMIAMQPKKANRKIFSTGPYRSLTQVYDPDTGDLTDDPDRVKKTIRDKYAVELGKKDAHGTAEWKNHVPRPPEPEHEQMEFSEKLFYYKLDHLRNGKMPGVDDVMNEWLKSIDRSIQNELYLWAKHHWDTGCSLPDEFVHSLVPEFHAAWARVHA